jgi:hypothetical protein
VHAPEALPVSPWLCLRAPAPLRLVCCPCAGAWSCQAPAEVSWLHPVALLYPPCDSVAWLHSCLAL